MVLFQSLVIRLFIQRVLTCCRTHSRRVRRIADSFGRLAVIFVTDCYGYITGALVQALVKNSRFTLGTAVLTTIAWIGFFDGLSKRHPKQAIF